MPASFKRRPRDRAEEAQGPLSPKSRLVADVAEGPGRAMPDVAVVDVYLRKDDKCYGRIDRLHARGIRTVVITGINDVSLGPGKAIAVLQKPFDEESLLAALRPSRTE